VTTKGNSPMKWTDVDSIVQSIRPLLAGHGPLLQGYVLGDLVAIWLAGHEALGDPVATEKLRADLLAMHCDLVRCLVPINAKEIGTTPYEIGQRSQR
jgi:hypothetical protein